jgi:hypothetical protein
MPHLKMRFKPRVYAAIERAATLHGQTITRWAIPWLDAACGLPAPELPTVAKWRPTAALRRETVETSIRVSAAQLANYHNAAYMACLEDRVGTWAVMVLAVAAGISELDIQLKRLEG